MALQIWCPLIKDIHNQGISNIMPSASGATFTTSGKIGSGALNSSNEFSVTIPALSGKKVWSFCFWGYVVSSTITSNWTQIARINDGSSNFRVEVCPKTTSNGIYCYSTHNNSGYAISSESISSPNGGYYDQWAHFCLTSDGTTIFKYMNGELIGTCSYNGAGAITGTFVLTNNNRIYKNDLRVYDHCLSICELKAISSALVLHYPLNDAYVEGTTNIASNLSPSQIGGWQKMTITKLSTNNYHLKHQTSDSANLSYWSTFVYTLPSEYSNKTISFSARIKNISYNDIDDSSWLYIGPGNNGQYPTHGSATFYCYELKENQLISWTGILSNSNRYVLVELWNNANSTSGSIEFDLVNIQIEEKDHVTPYTPNTRNEIIVHDCSGYQNNGTVEEFKAAGNNLVTGLTAGGQTTVSGGTVTTSGVNADTYFTINLSESIVIGQTYTLSCIGKNIPTNGYFGFPLGWQGNTSLIFNIKNGYNEIIFTANDGSWGTNRLFMDDYDRGTAYMNQCEFTNFKLYKHSIVNSGLNVVFDSPRYKIGAKFNGQHSIWLSSPLGSGAKEELTVSFWHKPNSQGNYRTIVSNNYPHSGFWIGCNCEGYGLWYYGGSFYVRSQSPLPNDIWYHCALTYKNQTYQWYLNGVPVTTSIYGTFKAPTFSSSISIGGNTNGDMKGGSSDYRQYGALSDFRIYSTALSADDIKELYNTSAYVLDNGTLLTYSIEE